MATLSYTRPSIPGTTAPAAVAASAGGDKVLPNEYGFIKINNGGGGAVIVTVAVPGNTRYGRPEPDITNTIAAGASEVMGPFPADLADPSDGLVAITYDGVTSVTVEAYSAI